MSSFVSQKPFDETPRRSQSLSNDRCQNILYKAVFEHFKEIKSIAALLLASKSFQNSSFGANFVVNFLIEENTIQLLITVLAPSSCFSLQFVPSLSISIGNESIRIVLAMSNFVGELVSRNYLHLSLRSLALEQVNSEIVDAFFGSGTTWLRLEELALNSTSPCDSAMARISKSAPHLTSLSFAHGTATDDCLEPVSKLSSLTSLHFLCCDAVTGAGLHHISALSQMKTLILSSSSNVGDVGLEHLAPLTGITTLWLDGAGITDSGLQHIGALVNVTHLDLNNCDAITDDGCECIAGLSNLTWLVIGSFCPITDRGLEHLSELSNLESLSLAHLRGITNAGIEHIAKCSTLVELSLGSCSAISDDALLHISTLSRLAHLDVSGTDISDAGLQHLVKLPCIKVLLLMFCEKITDVGLEHLSPLSTLTTVSVVFCKKITDAGITTLGKLPRIEKIDVYGCDKITATGKKQFMAAHPDCELRTL